MDNKNLKWLDKHSILTEDDIPMLEASAAIHQFRHGKAQEEAEQAAHSDYVKEHAIKSMAHHLLGSKAALAVNNLEAAMQHGKGYEAASDKGGFSLEQIPSEVIEHLKKEDLGGIYKFKNHNSDSLFLPTDEKGKIDNTVVENSSSISIKKLLFNLHKFKDLLS